MSADLFTSILEIGEENRNAIEHMRQAGRDAASKDREFKMLRATKELELRAQGHPAGMVKDLAEGDEQVSLARFKAQCAESDQMADKELIQNNKKIMDTLKSQMEFERVGRTEDDYLDY